jgi:hypothetical protein
MATRYALAVCKLNPGWHPATPPRAPLRTPAPYWEWVSVVVVVLAGTVLCSVVVVVLWEVSPFLSFTVVEQADSDIRATAARQGMISFFISMIVVWFVTLQARKLHQRLVVGYGV